MSGKRKVTTAYEMFVNSNVTQAARVGQGAYTYKELAEMVGLKPTQHFRRRVNQLAADGILAIVPAFTPRGNIENRFMIAITETEMGHPF